MKRFSSLSSLLVLTLFALCALSVLLSGAGVYRRLARWDAQERRTCAQYLSTKVRQCPEGWLVEPFGGSEALVLPQTIEGQAYVSRIYCHDGSLMELFTAREGDFAPEDGERLLPLRALTFHAEGNILNATLTDMEGVETTLTFSARVGEEVRP